MGLCGPYELVESRRVVFAARTTALSDDDFTRAAFELNPAVLIDAEDFEALEEIGHAAALGPGPACALAS